MIVDADARGGEVIWRPGEDEVSASQVRRFARFVRSCDVPIGNDYAELWRWSIEQPDRFWDAWVSFVGLELGGEPGPVVTADPMPATRWFPGRTLNFAEYLLEEREGVAIIGVAEDGDREEISWSELRERVGAVAAYLREAGVGPGDRVVGILPNIPEAVIALLATASIGAVWSVCAPEFGPGAILARFRQLEPKVVIAVPGYRLGGTDRDRRSELQTILDGLDTVRRVVWVTHRVSTPVPPVTVAMSEWTTLVAAATQPRYEQVEFSHPLWVLFSSGTTGIPKGIVHGHGGALLESLKLVAIHGDMGPGDRFFSVASTSWVVWNALVAALGVGTTAVLLDGNPTYPSVDHVWRVAAAEHVTVLGVSAGFVHACLQSGLTPGREHDLSALRCLQVTGSILSDDGYRWVYRSVGDIWLTSMTGGTDIASVFAGGVPTVPVRVGLIQVPALGVALEAWDEQGCPTVGIGELVVTGPLPSMPLFFWGDADGTRYRSSYFSTYPGVWRHGDFIRVEAGGIRILGRSDSTLNRNGLRLGPADIYSVVESLPEISEALVIGAELGTDYYMPLFVVLEPSADETRARAAIVQSIRANLSARYLPDEIIVMPGIPHTRTGKKLEVPVKRLIQGAALADVADPGAVDDPDLLEMYATFARRRSVVAG